MRLSDTAFPIQVAQAERLRYVMVLNPVLKEQFDCSEDLLLEHLDIDQRADYDQWGAFVVVAPSNRQYVLIMREAMNIWTAGIWACVAFAQTQWAQYIMVPDMMVMQLLILQTDENRFRMTARWYSNGIRRDGL